MRAQGEVIIRDALRELDMWGAGAVFQLTEYEDSHKAKVMLIKEWKELVTQVGIVLLQAVIIQMCIVICCQMEYNSAILLLVVLFDSIVQRMNRQESLWMHTAQGPLDAPQIQNITLEKACNKEIICKDT